MKVYVVERGVYSDRYPDAVYASLALAMQHGGKDEVWSGDGGWNNDKDWDDALTITEFVVREGVEL